jgi:uncharacterized protein (DUF2141 family)
MQKTIITIFSVFLLLVLCGFKSEVQTKLKVVVTNFENKKSTKIQVSVFSEKGFLEKLIQSKSVMISGAKVIVEFDLPPGEYAVSSYHDINSNGKLDRYFIGKPKEPYGFSNNVNPFGKPSYNECKFTLANSPKSISIKLLN